MEAESRRALGWVGFSKYESVLIREEMLRSRFVGRVASACTHRSEGGRWIKMDEPFSVF